MTNKELAEFMFPNITKTIADLEKEYPERGENVTVTRYAPSPTGFMHIGNFYSVVVDYVIASGNEYKFVTYTELESLAKRYAEI